MLAECVLPQISLLAEDILPRISQIYTELLAEDVLPQISQICTEVRLPSRGCTCLKCTNRARSAPTKQNRYSPTESTEPTELLAECILPQIAQIYTDCLGAFKGVHLSQVHPLKLAASVSICEICGRLFSAEGSVNSACSVGGTLLRRRQGYLRYYLRTLTICVNL